MQAQPEDFEIAEKPLGLHALQPPTCSVGKQDTPGKSTATCQFVCLLRIKLITGANKK